MKLVNISDLLQSMIIDPRPSLQNTNKNSSHIHKNKLKCDISKLDSPSPAVDVPLGWQQGNKY